MRNIKINEAETIFEVFWQGPNLRNKNYFVLDEYRKMPNGVAEFQYRNWSAQTKIAPKLPKDHVPAVLERDCQLDIRDYDRMKMFAGIDKGMYFRMICCIDGVDTVVYDLHGLGDRCEYVAEISGNMLTKIRMEFQDHCGEGAISQIVWLGLSNSEREHKMLTAPSPYTPEWIGCMTDTPVAAPQLHLFFDDDGLKQLRKKVQLPEFARWMDSLRKKAKKDLQIVPENEVGKLVLRHDRRFVRDRDMQRPVLFGSMELLAFVGLIDEDAEMLKMACRMAMAICHSEYFFESDMGVFPGVTWHHLCFSEASICRSLIKTLDWAGGYLSDHGKNLIYQSILTKGLPIIDMVIQRDDDVWLCNQGLVFENSLITILAAFQKRWPRYASRLDEAERNFFHMWENYVFPDGGSGEGPAYWNYTMTNIIDALYVLARARNKPIEDYVPELVRKSGNYANVLLSETGKGWLPINDCHPGGTFSLKIVQFLARIGAGEIWKQKSNEMLKYGSEVEALIQAQLFDIAEHQAPETFIHMPVAGITKVRRETEDLGVTALYAISGAAIWGHTHKDKGSFVLEADHTALLIDRGCCDYYNTYQTMIVNAELHNVLAAVDGEKILNQGGAGAEFSGEILKSEYENECFTYATDVTAPWKGAFKKIVRNISSPNAYEYIIEDVAELNAGDGVCFILNTYGQITQEGETYVITDAGKRIAVTTENWKPTRAEYGVHGQDGNGKPVSRLCLYCSGSRDYDLVTKLMLSKEA